MRIILFSILLSSAALAGIKECNSRAKAQTKPKDLILDTDECFEEFEATMTKEQCFELALGLPTNAALEMKQRCSQKFKINCIDGEAISDTRECEALINKAPDFGACNELSRKLKAEPQKNWVTRKCFARFKAQLSLRKCEDLAGKMTILKDKDDLRLECYEQYADSLYLRTCQNFADSTSSVKEKLRHLCLKQFRKDLTAEECRKHASEISDDFWRSESLKVCR